jgi:hypothetical protein
LLPRFAPAAFSFLQLVVRTLSNKKTIRKILEPNKDLALTLNFVFTLTLTVSPINVVGASVLGATFGIPI